MALQRYLIVISTCFSLMTNDVKRLLILILTTHISSLVKSLLTIFKLGELSSYYWVGILSQWDFCERMKHLCPKASIICNTLTTFQRFYNRASGTQSWGEYLGRIEQRVTQIYFCPLSFRWEIMLKLICTYM